MVITPVLQDPPFELLLPDELGRIRLGAIAGADSQGDQPVAVVAFLQHQGSRSTGSVEPRCPVAHVLPSGRYARSPGTARGSRSSFAKEALLAKAPGLRRGA